MIGADASRALTPRVSNHSGPNVPSPNPRCDPRIEIATTFRGLATMLLSAACALLTWSAVWISYPRSYRDWRSEAVVFGFLCASGPLIAAAVSLHALRRKTSFESPVGRFFIKLAIVVPISVFLFAVSVARIDAATLNSETLLPSLVGMVLLLLMAIVGTIRFFVPADAGRREDQRFEHRLVIASVAGPILALLFWSVLNIPLVEWRASAIAGASPYCVQVPSRFLHYKPVTSWIDLAGLRMQAPYERWGKREVQSTFHEILVVKRDAATEYYNWSYAAQNFVRIPEDTRSATHVSADCEPKPGFLYTLDVF